MSGFEPVTRPSIFVTSGGRTGTLFFSRAIARLLPTCRAFHEPDVMQQTSLSHCLQAARRFGLLHVTVGKFSTARSMRRLSLARQTRRVDRDWAAAALCHARSQFVERLDCATYVECNCQLLGLIDVLPEAFPNSNTIFIVRDGRDWVRSTISHTGGHHSNWDLVQWLRLGRLAATMVPGDPWYEAWDSFDVFQKQCWLWSFTTAHALSTLPSNPHSRWFRFEDLFFHDRRYETLRELMNFATVFPDGTKVEYEPLEGILDERINVSRPGTVPHWRDWSVEQVRNFQLICGPQMDQLGYGSESTWQQMCARGVLE